MAKDAVYEGEREVRTFADLAHGAGVLIMKTEQERKGSYYTTMSSLLLTAFTFEAYLNHLGCIKIIFWNDIESIKVMEKYSVLCKNLRIEPDFSLRPYQTLTALFKFRNSIAHGNSKILKKEKVIDSQDSPHAHIPKTEWEEYCKLKNAKRAKEDISEIIKELHKEASLGDHPFMHGLTISSVSLKRPTIK